MELIYLWVEQYKIYTNENFHFSNVFNFQLGKEEDENSYLLTVSELDIDILNTKNFLYSSKQNILNTSVIVGDNGAGKTTLLRCLIDIFTNKKESTKFIVAFMDDSQLKIFSYNISNLIIKMEDVGGKYYILQEDEFLRFIDQTKIIYINNVLDVNDYNMNFTSKELMKGNIVNASLGALIRNDSKGGDINSINSYFNEELYRQLRFIYGENNWHLDNLIPFKMPSNLKIKHVDVDERKKEIKREVEILVDTYNIESENRTPGKQKQINTVKSFIDKLKKPSVTDDDRVFWLNSLGQHLLLNVIEEVFRSVQSSRNSFTSIYLVDSIADSVFIDSEQRNTSYLEYIRIYLNRLEERLLKKKANVNIKQYIEFLTWLIDNNFYDFDISNKTSNSIIVNLNKIDREIFSEFMNFYNMTSQTNYYLNFSWGLSTGENNLLSLYARLYSTLKSVRSQESSKNTDFQNYFQRRNECRNVLLLIDEADLSYHPKWQVRYIDSLLKVLGEIYKEYTVQIILTTHSPILLSDIPKSNVIYLKDGINDSANNHQETFRQNIHTLFTDAFFLDKSTAGYYSNNIIGEIGDELNKISEQLSNELDIEKINVYKSIIKIIGEPVIKQAYEFKLKKIEASYRTGLLSKSIDLFEKLSSQEKNEFINHIINSSEEESTDEEN